MAIISEIKCARCDKKYSGLRSRCPYCSARRIGRGKYSEDGEDNRGKMLIGILILAALTVGAAVLLITTPADEPDPVAVEPPGYEYNDNDDSLLGDPHTVEGAGLEENDNDENDNDNDNDDDNDDEPLPTINSVAITFAGTVVVDFMEPVATQIPLAVRIDPAAAGQYADIVWYSSHPTIVDIVPSVDGHNATTHHISAGMSTITVTVTAPDGTEHTAETIARTR